MKVLYFEGEEKSPGHFANLAVLPSDSCAKGIHEADLAQDCYGEQHCKNCGMVLPRLKGEFGK